MLVGVRRACHLDYDVQPYPGVVADNPDDGLREATINALTRTELSRGGKQHIFTTADAYPMVTSDDLVRFMRDAPIDWEVLQLFSDTTHQVTSTDPPEQTVTYNHSKNVWKPLDPGPEGWAGAHTMVFRNEDIVRTYVAALMESSDAIDAVLKDLHASGKLKVYRHAVENLFVQWRPEGVHVKDRRFLVGLTSYKRIRDAIRQIYTFMDQSYTNFILHVLLKGVDEVDWKYRLEHNFRHFMDEGRLVVDCVPNENQLNNLLQLPMNIPEESYDLITKVDDDDWYDREYMKGLNTIHRSMFTDVSSRLLWAPGAFYQESGFPIFSGNRVGAFNGRTMVFTKELIGITRKYAESGQNANTIATCLRGRHKGFAGEDFKWREDALQSVLADSLGVIDRSDIDPAYTGTCVTQMGQTMTRSGLLNENRNTNYMNLRYDHVIRITQDSYRYRILGSTMFNLLDPGNKVASVIDKGKDYYVIKWQDSAKVEILKRRPNGYWGAVSSL